MGMVFNDFSYFLDMILCMIFATLHTLNSIPFTISGAMGKFLRPPDLWVGESSFYCKVMRLYSWLCSWDVWVSYFLHFMAQAPGGT